MLRKSLISFLLLAAIIVGGYYVYKEFLKLEQNQQSALHYLPKDKTVLVLELENPREILQQVFTSSLVWKEFSTNDQFKKFQDSWNKIDSLIEVNEALIPKSTIGIVENNSRLDYVMISQMSRSNYDMILSCFNKDTNITVFNKEGTLSYVEGNMFFSTSKDYLDSILIYEEDNLIDDVRFNKNYLTKSNNNSEIVLSINFKKLPFLAKKLETSVYGGNQLEWGVYTLSFNEDGLSMLGISTNERLADVETEIMNPEFYEFLPVNIESLEVLTIDSMRLFVDDSITWRNNEICACEFWEDGMSWHDNQMVHFSSNFSSANYLAINVKDRLSFLDQTSSFIRVDSVSNGFLNQKENQIFEILTNLNFEETFNTNFEPNFYTFINNYVVFSRGKESLEQLITNSKFNKTFSSNIDLFSFLKEVSSNKALARNIKKGFLFDPSLSFKGVSILEHSYKKDSTVYSTFNYSLAYNIGGLKNDASWELYFDKPLIGDVFLTSNHKINDKEIVVQDSSYMLYFISTSGTIKWKKQLDGKLISDITTVDMYKNGKYQMLLNTSTKIYIIDVLGRDVKGFPIHQEGITSPVNIFDYDNNGDYRLPVITGNTVRMYDRLGNEVQGWGNPRLKNIGVNKVRFMRLVGKDYILVNDTGKHVYLFDRKGNIRHKLDKKFTADYFYVDFGSNLLNTRAIYFDKVTNKLKKQFFNNENSISLISPTDTITNFHYLNFNNQGFEKNYVLESDTKLIVFDKAGGTKNKIPLVDGHDKLSILRNSIVYVNPETKELVIRAKIGVDNTYYNECEAYTVDEKFDYSRLILRKGNKLQMVIHK